MDQHSESMNTLCLVGLSFLSHTLQFGKFIWEGCLPELPSKIKLGRSEKLLRSYQKIRIYLSGGIKKSFQEQFIEAENRGRLQARDELLKISALK